VGRFRVERATFRDGEYTYEIQLGSGFFFVRRYVCGGPIKLLYTNGEFGPASGWFDPAVPPAFFVSFEEAERWFEERVLGVGETMFRSIEL
jgi:hypothetical protein